MTEKIRINAGRGYDVLIGQELLSQGGERIKDIFPSGRIAIVTDSKVAELYLDKVTDSLRASGFSTLHRIFPRGEGSKNLTTLSILLEFFAREALTRSDLVLALGGGVVGDMAGFAASVYQRGMNYVQVPTTLLAAVDSSVGGKTAVNLAAGKNLVGAFHQPLAVLCDTNCLSTLPESIFSEGVGECIKYGMLTDKKLLDLFSEENPRDHLEEIIARCVDIKRRYVEEDEFDTGNRRFLNLGHTLGHAIEVCSDYSFPHGHAVAVGMVMICRAGEDLGWTEAGATEALTSLLLRNKLPVSCDYEASRLYEGALRDKKRSGDAITLVVPHRPGECFLKTVSLEELKEVVSLGKEDR